MSSHEAAPEQPGEHVVALQVTDDWSKYGRPRRWFGAVCTCGWSADPVVQKWAATERGREHVATHQPEGSQP